MRRPAKPENIAKLTPEQLRVFQAWEAEAEKAEALMQQILDALAHDDKAEVSRLTQELDELIPVQCEHGRSVYLSCIACTTIEKMVYPELYDADGDRINDLYDLLPVHKSDKTMN